MKLLLADDETLIKRWTYATDKTTDEQYDNHMLFVTDKRIIAASESKSRISRTEIPISSVKSVSSSYSKNKQVDIKIGMIIVGLLIFIPCLILSIISGSKSSNDPLMILWILLTIIGFTVFIIGACSRKNSSYAGFKLTIKTYGDETTSLQIGKNFSTDSKVQQTVIINKIMLNEEAIYDIINTIGLLTITKQIPTKVLENN